LAVLPPRDRGKVDGLERIGALRGDGRGRAHRTHGAAGQLVAVSGTLARGPERAGTARGCECCEQDQLAHRGYHRLGSLRGHRDMSAGLWIIVLEAGVALALALALVWWTLPKKPKSAGEARDTHK